MLLLAITSLAQAAKETPYLAQLVAEQKLPPVDERLPDDPLVVKTFGSQGGRLNMLMAKAKDTRMMTVFGYARLVGYDQNLELQPDILAAYEVKEGRIFTLHLRHGMKWSDGAPFTAEDFRFWWEDEATNEELNPFGLPAELLVQGQGPTFEVLDQYTVRYTWAAPNPAFLPALAAPSPTYIYAPFHYLKRYHPRYQDPEKLKAMVEKSRKRNWMGLFYKYAHSYKQDNPNLPTLQPWVVRTESPAERFLFSRNPYYHRVDSQGHQLPYLDEVMVNLASSSLIPAKTGAGESDLQARYLQMDNYTFLRQAEHRNDNRVLLWKSGTGSQVTLYPNMNCSDPVWQKLLQNTTFRRALSLGINRHEINQAIYFGLGIEGNDSLLPDSNLYDPRFRYAWAQFDPETANRMLDGLGLTKRDDRGLRLLPDGRPMELIVHTTGEFTEETDVLALVKDSWQQLGILIHPRPSEREVFRNRVYSGEACLSVFTGLPNALPTSAMSPAELAPTTQDQLQWPEWGKYYETSGGGQAPTLPEAQQLLDLFKQWRNTTDDSERLQIWNQMQQIYASQVFSIGTVAGILQPVVVSKALHNVPEKGYYNWEPQSFFGIYRMDQFWFDPSTAQSRPLSDDRLPQESK
ncbi:ABC transporter substrate-binding protein [Pokkaliibacter sp. CJK22405]|uniref:ABC transporter substrate-binding protein n=1 Tax=Pokkaliibacter sp. CJK22405 TaxID=3384615 RepID=UPI003984BAAD